MPTAIAAAIPTRRLSDTSLLPQDVPHAPHRVQEPWLAAGLGLAPQVTHVHTEGIGGGTEVIAPHVLEDLRAGQDLAGVAEEELEEEELRFGQLDRPVAPTHLVGPRVEHQICEPQRLTLSVLTRPTKQRPQAGLELPQGKRFDQVVIRSGIQSPDPVVN